MTMELRRERGEVLRSYSFSLFVDPTHIPPADILSLQPKFTSKCWHVSS